MVIPYQTANILHGTQISADISSCVLLFATINFWECMNQPCTCKWRPASLWWFTLPCTIMIVCSKSNWTQKVVRLYAELWTCWRNMVPTKQTFSWWHCLLLPGELRGVWTPFQTLPCWRRKYMNKAPPTLDQSISVQIDKFKTPRITMALILLQSCTDISISWSMHNWTKILITVWKITHKLLIHNNFFTINTTQIWN